MFLKGTSTTSTIRKEGGFKTWTQPQSQGFNEEHHCEEFLKLDFSRRKDNFCSSCQGGDQALEEPQDLWGTLTEHLPWPAPSPVTLHLCNPGSVPSARKRAHGTGRWDLFSLLVELESEIKPDETVNNWQRHYIKHNWMAIQTGASDHIKADPSKTDLIRTRPLEPWTLTRKQLDNSRPHKTGKNWGWTFKHLGESISINNHSSLL